MKKHWQTVSSLSMKVHNLKLKTVLWFKAKVVVFKSMEEQPLKVLLRSKRMLFLIWLLVKKNRWTWYKKTVLFKVNVPLYVVRLVLRMNVAATAIAAAVSVLKLRATWSLMIRPKFNWTVYPRKAQGGFKSKEGRRLKLQKTHGKVMVRKVLCWVLNHLKTPAQVKVQLKKKHGWPKPVINTVISCCKNCWPNKNLKNPPKKYWTKRCATLVPWTVTKASNPMSTPRKPDKN